MPVQTGYGATTLDYLICWNGQFVGIECKAGRKKPTPRQLHVMEAINKSWGYTFIVDGSEPVCEQMKIIQEILFKDESDAVTRSQA
jgi:hypothetical protein